MRPSKSRPFGRCATSFLLANLTLIIGALALVVVNGFFVAAEFSLARARVTRLDQTAAAGGVAGGLAREQVREINRYLAACQLGVTVASLGLGWLGEHAFGHLLEPLTNVIGLDDSASALAAGLGAFVVITALHVVVGELAPKAIAIQRPEATALVIARPLELFTRAFAPLVLTLNGAGNGIVRMLGVEPAGEDTLTSSPDDLRRMITQSEREGALGRERAEMLDGVFSLQVRRVRDIMTPRPEVRTLDSTETVGQALADTIRSRHSRFPILSDSGVVGVVHIGELAKGLLGDGGSTAVGGLAGAPLFVPETQSVGDLLLELRRQRASLAVVLDEYGEFSGVVTVEDAIEEIVGEIDDERDRSNSIGGRADGRLVVPGHIGLDDLRHRGVALTDPNVTSIGGLLFTRPGCLPAVGDTVVADSWRLSVEAMRGTRVVLVALEPAGPGDENR